MPWIKRTLRFAFFTIILVGATQQWGCNTMEGVGKDVEKGGESLQDAAK